MGSLTVGDVVLVAFPYADFTKFKKRPALVAAKAEFNNLILCQITSKADTSKWAISLESTDFSVGGLGLDSYVRTDKIFTVEQSIVEATIGRLHPEKLRDLQTAIREIFS